MNYRKIYIIKTNSEEECARVLDMIHDQLKGNEDYGNDNIVLNDSATRQDGTVNEVRVYFYEECSYIPKIELY